MRLLLTYETKSIWNIRANFRRGNKPKCSHGVSDAHLVIVFCVVLQVANQMVQSQQTILIHYLLWLTKFTIKVLFNIKMPV